ncbi:MAG: class I SAM-dependent methyltransferase [Myxococcales bacterium]|nr:class I SAM-dependent methyltransferase [Myxococcales bacterium]
MRPYYDHERAYRMIAEAGGTGWDDLPTNHGPQIGGYLALDAFLASSLAVPGDALDLGCGGGQASIKVAARGYRVTGVDFAPTAIELARRNAPEIEFVVGDCLALELGSERFDLAIDNHVLHCLIGRDRGRFLREIARVLRPGGLLFSESMSREGNVDFETFGFDPTTFISRNGNRYLVGASELDAELAAAGFEIVQRQARPDLELAMGHHLMRVARRLPG